MIASAAESAASLPVRKARTAFSRPGPMTSIGNGTPMTPVDATSTCEVRMPSNAAARDAVSRASWSPRSPVQAFAQPEFATIARIASPSVARCSFETISGAALTSLVVMTDAQTRSPPKSISARSALRRLMPDMTPLQRTSGTAPRPPRKSTSRNESDDWDASAKSGLLRVTAHDVEVLHGVAGRAFTEVVVARHYVHDAAAYADSDLRVVRPGESREIRYARRVQDFNEQIGRVRLEEGSADLVLIDRFSHNRVRVNEHTTRHRDDVGREDEGNADAERPQLLFDLSTMAMRWDAVCAHVAVDLRVH